VAHVDAELWERKLRKILEISTEEEAEIWLDNLYFVAMTDPDGCECYFGERREVELCDGGAERAVRMLFLLVLLLLLLVLMGGAPVARADADVSFASASGHPGEQGRVRRSLC